MSFFNDLYTYIRSEDQQHQKENFTTVILAEILRDKP